LTQWHYNDGGQLKGPISLEELKAKVMAGELSGASLVWQVGTKDWSEVRNFPELVEQVQTPPPLPKSVIIAAGSRSVGAAVADALPALGISFFVVGIFLAIAIPQSRDNAGLITISVLVGIGIAVALVLFFRPKQDVSAPSHAWRRFLAKLLDVEIASFAGYIAVVIVSPESYRGFAAVFLSATLVVWFMFEVPMKGKTLGRYLFGVHLSPITGTPNYFMRLVKLMFFGMALALPVLSTISNAIVYKRLRETGTTIWDKGAFEVSTEKGGIGKLLLGIALSLFLMSVIGFLSNLNPSALAKMSRSHPAAEPSMRHDGSALSYSAFDDMRKQYPGWNDRDIIDDVARGNNVTPEYVVGYYGLICHRDHMNCEAK
jgi:hypothetical protein